MAKEVTGRNAQKKGGVVGIRAKLLAIILALSIIPLLVMTVLLTQTLKSNVLELEEALATQKVRTAQEETLSIIDDTFVGVDLLARNTRLSEAVANPTEETVALANEELALADEGFSSEGLMFVYDKNGMQIARADDNDLNDISDREYAQKSIAGEKYLSDVAISKVTGEANVYMADPLITKDGKIVGGVARSASLAQLSEDIKSIDSDYMDVTILDRTGALAATTEEQYDLTSGEIIDLSSEEYYTLAQANSSGNTVTTHNGSKVLLTYLLDDTTGWTIAVFVDYDYVLTPYQKSLVYALIILIIAIVMVIIIGSLYAASIAKPIKNVKEFASILASGDFTTDPLHIKRRDELGDMADSLNQMYYNNADVIRNIGTGSHHVSQSSTELADTSNDLLTRFEEVASSMQRVNDAMTNTGAATEQVSASANEVNESVERLAEETRSTKEEVINISKKAEEIEREGRESSETAIAIAKERGRELEEATEAAKVVSEISTMADSIAGIANQINLLSLNASIEAARAGEHGRGFAVVAGEINTLAEQTKSAVDEIQGTVNKIQSAFDQLSGSAQALLGFVRETVGPDYEKFISIGQEYGSDAQKFGELADNIAEMVR
ncbi:MAG: methyl-accepting chemotaxis protein, partial [Lachnospiraceae bacterium]|nr:methyl-accepting chemotaxis protein [Lachnospiraceae bacterium]